MFAWIFWQIFANGDDIYKAWQNKSKFFEYEFLKYVNLLRFWILLKPSESMIKLKSKCLKELIFMLLGYNGFFSRIFHVLAVSDLFWFYAHLPNSGRIWVWRRRMGSLRTPGRIPASWRSPGIRRIPRKQELGRMESLRCICIEYNYALGNHL